MTKHKLSVAMRNVKTIAAPLIVRAGSTGALLGACITAGIAGFSAVQATVYPEQFGLWGMNGGQILFMAMLGLIVGAMAGLASCAGSLAALWIAATTSSAHVLPRALTAAVGAAVSTIAYVVIACLVLGAAGLAPVVIGAGLATASGLLAGFHTRRLTHRPDGCVERGMSSATA